MKTFKQFLEEGKNKRIPKIFKVIHRKGYMTPYNPRAGLTGYDPSKLI